MLCLSTVGIQTYSRQYSLRLHTIKCLLVVHIWALICAGLTSVCISARYKYSSLTCSYTQLECPSSFLYVLLCYQSLPCGNGALIFLSPVSELPAPPPLSKVTFHVRLNCYFSNLPKKSFLACSVGHYEKCAFPFGSQTGKLGEGEAERKARTHSIQGSE